ncbi:MAG: hypothetical protein COT39_02050 [Parcubacteria group bacterium CG08_land_8_20_14_0_20_48_21]|nr:MAG: hypothetical protein AUK21_04270 [Parcubacteria group bacterium CG2_30_48_51]PIS32917.1 MAG: hypothetical protein COT39_02050 [Parcubacteria group bacterium CG08_land_8_20_14_0_20_48_21]PIW79573.1 MAG: hypothetical protein COZ99_00275 [Parcubacteria group bacterium CG_4_8_14_3_um_filter_48_16]PIY77848.1 MAG: hypothetical protein COY83_03065 [Parcubacteria group bacterium CG_4_10_14_0_8_um_filter_48_154]PIZ77346.1 MAG: hypothetical protein COY03_03150 [bacterium CG_4_10_14_0_2_um_filter_
MSLRERIEHDFHEARKTRQPEELSALRMLKSSLQNAAIEKRGALTDNEALKVVRTEIKRRKESARTYRSAGRAELAEHEEFEQSVYERYLPVAMEVDVLRALVRRVIEDTQAQGAGDTGRVMGSVMQEVAGRVEGNAVKEIVQRELAQRPAAKN